jgi:hypothetical protein
MSQSGRRPFPHHRTPLGFLFPLGRDPQATCWISPSNMRRRPTCSASIFRYFDLDRLAAIASPTRVKY